MKVEELGKFWFDETCSVEERSAIRPLLDKWHVLVPSWCESVHVMCLTHDDGNSGCTAAMKTEEEYRRAHLTIYGTWLNEPPEYREQAIIHELLHLHTERQRVFARDLIRTFAPDAQKDYFFEQLRKANESTTEDLMLALARVARG